MKSGFTGFTTNTAPIIIRDSFRLAKMICQDSVMADSPEKNSDALGPSPRRNSFPYILPLAHTEIHDTLVSRFYSESPISI